jgi:DNA topoisomerase-1
MQKIAEKHEDCTPEEVMKYSVPLHPERMPKGMADVLAKTYSATAEAVLSTTQKELSGLKGKIALYKGVSSRRNGELWEDKLGFWSSNIDFAKGFAGPDGTVWKYDVDPKDVIYSSRTEPHARKEYNEPGVKNVLKRWKTDQGKVLKVGDVDEFVIHYKGGAQKVGHGYDIEGLGAEFRAYSPEKSEKQILQEMINRFDWDGNLDPDEKQEKSIEKGSGNFGHAGRPNLVGGSAPRSGFKPYNKDDPKLPKHIQGLAVPPAWTNVQYNTKKDGELWIAGKNKKGDNVYIYNPEYSDMQDAEKWKREFELEKQFTPIMRKVNSDIHNQRNVEEASCLRLIIDTGIRPGSTKDTKALVKAYGATTLQGRHVVEEGKNVYVRFMGKKGVVQNHIVSNDAVAKDLLARKKAVKDNEDIFKTDSHKLLDYAHSQDGGAFKTKDFRTHFGTTEAKKEMDKLPAPSSPTEYRKSVLSVAKVVAAKLGNEPDMALSAYIRPEIFSGWRVHAGV